MPERAARIERLQVAEANVGTPLPFDAATAPTHGLPLLTRNPDDFVGLETAVSVIGT